MDSTYPFTMHPCNYSQGENSISTITLICLSTLTSWISLHYRTQSRRWPSTNSPSLNLSLSFI